MPYGGDPKNDVNDAVRAMVRDTSTSPSLTDNEIAFVVSEWPNKYYAAAAAAEMLQANGAEFVVEKKVGDLVLKKGTAQGGVAGNWQTLADSLRTQALNQGVAGYAGGISVSDKDTQRSDTDWDRTEIALGMHDDIGTSSTGRLGF